jgi:RNA polymerase sigma-70 factor (ECF subfamily)
LAVREDVTGLLLRWKAGDQSAADALTPIIYQELHKLAALYLRDERAAATLQPTALVNELYLRLVASDLPDWESRSHFYGVAAHRMRQILVQHARKHRATKRGNDAEKFQLDEVLCFAPEKSTAVVALDDALEQLARVDERKAKVIELRFFGGLSVEETARMIGVSVGTIGREQRFAEAWLRNEMAAGGAA